jgi:hypothetical protein
MAREKMTHKTMAHRREDSGEAARVKQPSREGVGQPSQTRGGQPSSKNRMRIRSMLQLALAFALTGALIAGGAFLPARIAEAFDSLFLRKVEVQALAPESEVLSVATPLINRLKLLAAPHFELASLPLQTGGYLDEKTVWEALDRELEELSARGLYPSAASFAETKGVVHAEASLYVLAGQPNVNGIIWRIEFANDNFLGQVCLDDESGKILSYSIRYNYVWSKGFFTERSGERWMEYLGLESDKLRLLEETDGQSADGAKPDSFAPSVSLSDTLAFGKTDVFTDPITVTIPITRFRFLFEAGTSPLGMYCEQFNDDVGTLISLRIVSSTWVAGEGSSLDGLADKFGGDTSSEGETASSVGKPPESLWTG